MNWFTELQCELSFETEDTFINSLKEFREECSNSLLRKFYPTDQAMKAFKDRKSPSAKTVDFMLTYLNDRHADKETKFADYAVGKLASKVRQHKYHVTRAIDLEEFRRKDYWAEKSDILSKQLCGWHHICRKRLNDRLVSEVIYIFPSKTLRQVVDAYWYRITDSGPSFYAGNFYCAENSLMGTFVNKSTDKILHPIHMIIGYRGDLNNRIRITTGFLNGATLSGKSVFHYPFAFVDHDNFQAPVVTESRFMNDAARRIAAWPDAERHKALFSETYNPTITDRDVLSAE